MPEFTSFSDVLKYIWFILRTLGLPLILRSFRYGFEKSYAELKYAEPIKPRGGLNLWWQALKKRHKPRPVPPAFETFTKPGPVKSWRHKEAILTLSCATTYVQIVAYAPSVIRVQMSESGIFNRLFSYAIQPSVSAWPPPPVTITEQDTLICFETSDLTIHIHKKNSCLDFLDKSGRPINLDAGSLGQHGSWVGAERQLASDAPVLGLGERALPLNLRGHYFEMWNRDPGGRYGLGEEALYQCHPWFISLTQDRAFGILFDNSYRSYFDMGQRHPERYTFTSLQGKLCYYFIAGPKIKTVLAHLAELTGKMPLPPLWALGLHQSRWSYKSKKAVSQVARQFRERQIPCDVIHLDIHYAQGYTPFTWHKFRFRHPEEMIKELHRDGFRVVPNINPGIKADRLNKIAEQGLKKDVFLKYPDGKIFRGPVWPGDCYFPDFTNPAARIWWGGLYKDLLQQGLAGFWHDMNEPAIFSPYEGTMPDVVYHSFEGKQASHSQMHNVYGMQMARATQEGLKALRSQQRPFILSRSGSVGIQRYAAVWTGDNESTWDHLRLSLSMILNLGLSGVAFAGADIGGFWGQPSPDLFVRWVQSAALFPLCRIHTANLTPSQDPWSYGPAVEAIVKRTIELRYRLLPYLYTSFWQASQTGLPIIRPMLLEFQADPQTHLLEDQFMIGDALLVAPVLTPDTSSRPIYLPQDHTWVDYWTGENHSGGQTLTVDAPLAHLPIFVKAGTVLPQWPLIQYTDQAETLQTIDYHLFAAPGQSTLYEDAGEGFAYQQGGYRTTQFVCRLVQNRIILTVRYQGDYIPPYTAINWAIHTPKPIKPTSITADSLPVSEWFEGDLANSLTFQTPLVQRLEILF